QVKESPPLFQLSSTEFGTFPYNVQVGILSSALEHGIPEQLFHNNLNNPPEAISAVKALSKANVQGQHIYNLNSSNSADILPRLHHDADTMTEIRNALSTGKEIITHTEAVSITGWSGAGYIIIDPLTGDGAYKIGGGQNGSWLSLFIFAFVMILFFAAIITIVATVGLGILGTFLVSFEVFGFLAWVYDINNAKTFDDFNRASAGAALISILGLVPLAEAGSAGAVAAQWFGILLGTMLTNPFGWFY
ncbi:MAG: hypothetical protein GWN00_40345, partial [Aliifodinibius sp.]|nr:hypothetical protein [Fodinibius sp.]NIV16764.1 hypothetical protein [Fodinibius sp.]NIY30805.1 hypothetical protein [Fodinibius sp.]